MKHIDTKYIGMCCIVWGLWFAVMVNFWWLLAD